MGIELTTEFFLGLGGVIVADLLLAGDNAVVIALAARNLPPDLRRKAILLGAGAAILLRGALTVAAVFLLGGGLPVVQLVGGIALLWIGWHLATENEDPADGVQVASTLKGAVRTILIADVVMSIDNVLAVSAIARNDFWLVVFGLVISIPIVMGGASVLLRAIDRFPVIVWAGAALILYVAVELMFADPIVHDHIPHALDGALVERAIAIAVALGIACLAWTRRPKNTHPGDVLQTAPPVVGDSSEPRLMHEASLPDD
ncbi:MAG: integral rane, YjbE family protein [Thermoleophilia bacterium]|nr:integral rane, YjbE family protein [Thermoleophilia bacterium]